MGWGKLGVAAVWGGEGGHGAGVPAPAVLHRGRGHAHDSPRHTPYTEAPHNEKNFHHQAPSMLEKKSAGAGGGGFGVGARRDDGSDCLLGVLPTSLGAR